MEIRIQYTLGVILVSSRTVEPGPGAGPVPDPAGARAISIIRYIIWMCVINRNLDASKNN